MKPPKLAQRESIRLFKLGKDQVIVVCGRRTRDCHETRIARIAPGKYVLKCGCISREAHRGEADDRYFIVQPVALGSRTREIEVIHRNGRDRLEVECLDKAHGQLVGSITALGSSQDLSLEAAFKDALGKLDPKALQSPSLVEVVSMGALYGGFSGFSRLFVRVEASPYKVRNAGDKI